MFKKILIATDLNEHSKKALKVGAEIADQFDSKIYFIHVVTLPDLIGNKKKSQPESELKLVENLTQRLVKTAKRILLEQSFSVIPPGDHTTQIVKVGDPATLIVRSAVQINADLIVIARGKNGNLGSVAERVTRFANCSVLIVPSRNPRGLVKKKARPRGRLAKPRRVRMSASTSGL